MTASRRLGLFGLVLLKLVTGTLATGMDIVRRNDTVKGDSQCQTYMCVSATVDGDTVNYVMSSTSSVKSVGWMGVGFGGSMVNSPMVIMWPNPDGNVTLSQRSVKSYIEPTVDNNPPRVASTASSLTSTSDSIKKLAFSVPVNNDNTHLVVFAISQTSPGSSDVGAHLQQHDWMGTFSLDLTKTLSPGSGGGQDSGGNPSSGGGSAVADTPLLPYQKQIVAHAVFCCLGFLVSLPAGSLLARYFRSYYSGWFKGHWIIQFTIAGPFVLIGTFLGIGSVSKTGGLHLVDNHMRLGLALFILWLFQCMLGYVIHTFKPRHPKKSPSAWKQRPLQNYAHAVIGLLIIALALAQVKNGLWTEWPKSTGRGVVRQGYRILWYLWVVLLPLLYAGGLFLLPRQFRQEQTRKPRRKSQSHKVDDRFGSDTGLPQVAGDYRHYHP